jgi:hypothetical protein
MGRHAVISDEQWAESCRRRVRGCTSELSAGDSDFARHRFRQDFDCAFAPSQVDVAKVLGTEPYGQFPLVRLKARRFDGECVLADANALAGLELNAVELHDGEASRFLAFNENAICESRSVEELAIDIPPDC